MREIIKSLSDLISRYDLVQLKAGERLVIFDPEGRRYIWIAKKPGIYNVEMDLVTNRRMISINEVRVGAQFTERGGPPFREYLLESLWGPELNKSC